ncbi:TROVE domain-containing protein, partial [Candidatus Pacearchaeota archaeon]|nr:TROVE domain-containing protein [Candidatus Pacearchaeota archaeon]
MGYLNKKKEVKEDRLMKTTHKNFMDGDSFDINNPLLRLKIVAASCFFGEPQYYKSDEKSKKIKRRKIINKSRFDYFDELIKVLSPIDKSDFKNLSPAETMERCIDEALTYNPEETLRIASELRNIDYIRVTPQVILVMAANRNDLKGSELIRKYAKEIIKRGDEPATGLAYQLSKYGKPIPNSLKRAWSDFLKSSNEYSLAKYRMESREVKTIDVIRLSGAYNDKTIKLLNGTLKLNTDDRETWESIRSSGGSWEKCIDVMGHMALLRNVKNLIENNISHKLWLDKLIETAPEGKQMPFRYYAAYRMVENIASPIILDGIEECLMLSLPNLPKLSGKNLILVDNSGSAENNISMYGTTQIRHIGNLMGVITGMVSDEGIVGVFGDRLTLKPIRKKSSVFDQLKDVNKIGDSIGSATENGVWIALKNAIEKKEHWDNIFIYSDMQAGHGGLYGINPDEYEAYLWRGTVKNIHVPKLINA